MSNITITIIIAIAVATLAVLPNISISIYNFIKKKSTPKKRHSDDDSLRNKDNFDDLHELHIAKAEELRANGPSRVEVMFTSDDNLKASHKEKDIIEPMSDMSQKDFRKLYRKTMKQEEIDSPKPKRGRPRKAKNAPKIKYKKRKNNQTTKAK